MVALLGACESKDSATASADTQAATDKDHEHDGACSCDKGKKGETVWCDKCGVGYVDGKKIKDKGEYEKVAKK